MTNLNRKFIITVFVIQFLFLGVLTVQAEEAATSPAKNPLCWTKQICEDDKGEFLQQGKEPCTGAWGLCYPSLDTYKTNLQIGLGGYGKQIANASQYIVAIYQVGLAIALIAVIVMIMIAGFRYMTAGGNPTTIGQAKSMIGNAIIGLVLLLGARLLFDTINPDIKNLTLPRAAKIRPFYQTPTLWCDEFFSQTRTNIKFATAGTASSPKPSSEIGAEKYQDYTKEEMAQQACSLAWYSFNDPTQLCLSRHCAEEGKACSLNDDGKSYDCVPVALTGEIAIPQGRNVTDFGFVQLLPVCGNGEILGSGVIAEGGKLPTGKYVYWFPQHLFAGGGGGGPGACEGGFKGYLLTVAVGESLGLPDTYGLKRQGNDCSTPFSDRGNAPPSNDADDIDPGAYKDQPDELFFQSANLAEGGLTCNINVTEAKMPAF